MNALIQSKAGYARPDAGMRPLRSIEYEAFARMTQKLSATWKTRRTAFSALVSALSDNELLWSTLAADVASQGNGLPAPLRSQLFYLYEFTVQHSRRVREENASVEALVDINTAVMRGLRGQGGAA